MTAWQCENCEVEGYSIEAVCWYCDGPVVVTARPAIEVISQGELT
jgi:DnaJ-class molecular chaperone